MNASIRVHANVARLFLLVLLTLCPKFSARGAEMRTLSGHVPSALVGLQPLGRLPGTNQLRLVLGLPLRNRPDLTNFLQRLYDPASPDYHHYLTPAEFTQRFGPTEQDYQAVVQFARSNRLSVAGTHDSRLLLDVRGNAADIEQAFRVTFHTYQHPTEARRFFATDVNPSVDSGLPILDITGLTDYALLRPASRKKPAPLAGLPASGSQSNGYYMGNDFRNAYAPGVSLTGAGQLVGLFEADSFYSIDISNYERVASLPDVPLISVPIDGGGTPGANNSEVALDIETTISMAPGLAGVVVFEGPDVVSDWLDILDYMASSNQIKQFSSSWGYTGGANPNTSFDAVFQSMAAHGQSFFQASGDGDAWVNPIWTPADSPYVTCVGGTALTMNGLGASYASETVWNSGFLGSNDAWSPNGNGYWGSGGGTSTIYSIPSWQQSVAAITPSASTTMRNVPDVALTADGVWVQYNNGGHADFMGTSCAAPLWAGFLALVNQQAAANSDTPPGFLNPAIYAIGQGASYTSCFNDITTGNNTNGQSHNLYQAGTGYDLCTGWGTPMGAGLINALAPLDDLLVSPSTGFIASGGQGGPFTVVSQSYVLTNTGVSPLTWSIGSAAPWLTVSPTAGTLSPGGPATTVTVGLNATASNEVVGAYNASVYFTNITDNVEQSRAFALNVVAPPAITADPASQYVFAGATVMFSVTTSGGLPQSFQWRQNGTNLSDGVNTSGSASTNLTLTGVSFPSSGAYTLVVSNAAAVVTSTPPAVLTVLPPAQQLVQNGGFETGSFSSWTMSGNFNDTFVSPGVTRYVHSGGYGGESVPASSLGYLSQTLATTPGGAYQLSLWLDSPDGAGPNEFSVAWNGSTLFDGTNLSNIGWTNLQFIVTASAASTLLDIGFRDDPSYLGLDDVSVVAATPRMQSAALAGGNFTVGWISLPGARYQIASSTNLALTNWTPMGGIITATNIFTPAGNLPHTNAQQFYRIELVP